MPEQVEELERVLPMCRAVLRRPAQMAEVRDELTRLRNALDVATDELSRFEAASDAVPALEEAFMRVQMAGIEFGDRADVTEQALRALTVPLVVIDRALRELPQVQRTTAVSWWPIKRIHDALVLGWGRAHYPVARNEPATSAAWVDAAWARERAPKFPHVPRTTITSRFRQIVVICYELISGDADHDPERQIKAFVRWNGTRRAAHAQGEGV